MLTIRMQRTGRKGLAQFRVIVQDSRFSPSSGRVVAQLGFYNPHTKETNIDKEKAAEYLKNGAQPSERVVKLLEAEKVKLPAWVAKSRTDREGKIRNAEKLRKNQPDEPAEPAPADEAAPEESADVADKPAEPEAPAEEARAEEPAAEPEASEAQSSTESSDSGAEEKAPESDESAEDAPAEAETEEKPADA